MKKLVLFTAMIVIAMVAKAQSFTPILADLSETYDVKYTCISLDSGLSTGYYGYGLFSAFLINAEGIEYIKMSKGGNPQVTDNLVADVQKIIKNLNMTRLLATKESKTNFGNIYIHITDKDKQSADYMIMEVRNGNTYQVVYAKGTIDYQRILTFHTNGISLD